MEALRKEIIKITTKTDTAMHHSVIICLQIDFTYDDTKSSYNNAMKKAIRKTINRDFKTTDPKDGTKLERIVVSDIDSGATINEWEGKSESD